MNWSKTLGILCVSVLFSLHAMANNDHTLEPIKTTKDTLKVEPKIKFNPLMLFSLPKALDPTEQKSTTKKEEDEDLGAI